MLLAGTMLLPCAAIARQQGQTTPTQVPAVVSASSASSAIPISPAPLPSAPVAGGTAPMIAKSGPGGSKASHSPEPASRAGVREDAALLAEGEKRFATNCGRCHQSPHHFPPRMMATIVRHMRVRATITDEDMRLILRYMTQ